LFQTSDPGAENYISASYVARPIFPGQTEATVQELAIRFDQKGHERPYQKAIIIDVVDGYLNPGDQIVVRLGDRRFGAKGTRVQTFVEEKFAMRWYIDPIGTSRFAAIKPDILFDIVSGPIDHLKLNSSRLVRPGVKFPVHFHAEDKWGNATNETTDLSASITIKNEANNEVVFQEITAFAAGRWTAASFQGITLKVEGDYVITAELDSHSITDYITASTTSPVPRILFADLHVHSDDTVGTNSTSYNFSYAQKIAGLDIVGYTANDFNITHAKWDATLSIIRTINSEGEFIVFPGTEWCGNSAAGGDHNVVFLDDPTTFPPEFPFDRFGNVARSFEWNEDGPSELIPGVWPLDELYATYGHSPSSHLLIPHVGGRRCNLGWHHPQLERLLEIGSAWGQFDWLLRDALSRGYKMGVSANSDEHRGRCGGGVPGTAVFGTKGGLTGVLSESLERGEVGRALRARRTFATSGERLVGLLSLEGAVLQGDEVVAQKNAEMKLNYSFYGSRGFSSMEVFNANGKIFHRDLWAETRADPDVLRVSWGGARLFDRYREAIWDGTIEVRGADIASIQPFGGILYIPEGESIVQSKSTVRFQTRTSGDLDGVNISFASNRKPLSIIIKGTLGGYVKVGDPLKGVIHKGQPKFELEGSWEDLVDSSNQIDGEQGTDGLRISIIGGADLFVAARVVPNVQLPRKLEGEFLVRRPDEQGGAVYCVAKEWDGGKVVTSPIFMV
jgi:hypothetical protein